MGTTKPWRLVCTALLVAASAATLAVGTSARAATPYDGAWSVLIMTDRGSCDPAYRYALRISNGVVTYGGEGGAPAQVSGRVNSGGRVSVSVAGGQGRAVGSGRLTAAGGSGSWRGSGSQASCAGRWTAERRG
jgi:hypothetical protein